MRILFIGCVASSLACLKKFIALKADIAGVVTKAKSAFNADFVSLQETAEQHGIPCFLAENANNADCLDWIRTREPEIIFCIGWSQLLKTDLMSIPKYGCVGFHPAALPLNRGRHPIIWALVLGLEETASTFFFMDEGADSGDILSQKPVPIDTGDDANTLYKKIVTAAEQQIEDFFPNLQSRTLARNPQNHTIANYWRKRDRQDGRIDFRMHSQEIARLVRALTHPYIGAHIEHQGTDVKVWQVRPSESWEKNLEPGKVLALHDTEITVKTADAAIILLKHEFDTLPKVGDYFL